MKTAELIEPEKPALKGQSLIQLPYGLLGFERVKNYVLVANPHEDPFMWLQMMDTARKSFLVVSPFLVLPDYSPNLPDADVDFLGLAEPADALVLNICTLRRDGHSTINLRGPVVINRHTLIAKQIIPENASLYSLVHPLPTV
jgi:flagellar assembly factor FliW